MARMGDIFGETARDFEHGVQAAEDWFTRRHGASQAPAAQPVTVDTATIGESMSLEALEDQARNDLSDGIAYAHDLLGRLRASAPGIVATIDAVAGNPTLARLAEAAAGRFLPPGVEEIALSMLSGLFASHGQPLQAAQPVQQAA